MERRDDRRRRDDTRTHKPRYERDRSRSPRSRSPHRRDHRDDRRRDRSPRRERKPPTGPSRPDRDRASDRLHQSTNSGGFTRKAGERLPADNRSNDADVKQIPGSRGRVQADVRTEDASKNEDSDDEMQRVMGFKAFRTTQNTKVPGNEKNFAVRKDKTSEYRQYMNRTGGFNRPLSPSRG